MHVDMQDSHPMPGCPALIAAAISDQDLITFQAWLRWTGMCSFLRNIYH